MILNSSYFAGKKYIIFGASSGIGRATALLLDELGAQVVLVARREDRLLEICNSLTVKGSYSITADLTEIESISDLISDVTKQIGKLDGMVYCAGISPLAPHNVTTPKLLNDVMQTNFFAFFECVRQFAKKANYNKNAKIVGISSLASIQPDRGQVAYAASKAAMDASVLCLAKEFVKKEININTVRPGIVHTEMFDSSPYIEYDPNERQPLGVMEASEIANVIAFLLSDYADKITGRCIDVDGGWLLNI